jgi:hypothetical protein
MPSVARDNEAIRTRRLLATGAGLLSLSCVLAPQTISHQRPGEMQWVRIAEDGRGFILQPSGRRFTPWGFNYDHDEHLRLLEDYWDPEWTKVAEDFREMNTLGANIVRIHLQLGRFMASPNELRPEALARLTRVLALAEQLNLYVDVTGLGCYRKADVPPWYDRLTEPERWAVQARFWEAIALRCTASPAVFCYDLMNEPVVPGGRRSPGEWLGPPFADRYHYVQFISLDRAKRPRAEIARRWIRHLAQAIRKHDRRHLITVGLVPWSLDRPGLTSGFVPSEIAPELDFISVHVYPEASNVDEALAILEGFSVGKPLLIEEMFPLRCSPSEFRRFLRESRRFASGWIGFYWGKTPQELRRSDDLADHLVLQWLDLFQQEAPTISHQPPSARP